jgi:hypothetical protein
MVLGTASCETVSPSNLGRPHMPASSIDQASSSRKPNSPLYGPSPYGSNIWRRYTCEPFHLDLTLYGPDNFL